MLRLYLFVQGRVGEGIEREQNVLLCLIAMRLAGNMFPCARISKDLFLPVAQTGRKEIVCSFRHLKNAAHKY